MPVTADTSLSDNQAARRQRVLQAAARLGAEGGYDAVQMRDVAATAEVALGTIYRYFPSKDALLGAAMVEWMQDLDRRMARRGPEGDTTSERVFDVLRRALATMEREPRLSEAVITALISDDREAASSIAAVNDLLLRVLVRAFPDEVSPETEAVIVRVLGHVWFSSLVAWRNGVGDLGWVAEELDAACHVLCDHLG